MGDTADIVPDGFGPDELEEAKSARSTTPSHLQERCPECKSVRIRSKVNKNSKREYDEGYYCAACETHFSEPLQPRKFRD